jgi:hypothetical protein
MGLLDFLKDKKETPEPVKTEPVKVEEAKKPELASTKGDFRIILHAKEKTLGIVHYSDINEDDEDVKEFDAEFDTYEEAQDAMHKIAEQHPDFIIEDCHKKI